MKTTLLRLVLAVVLGVFTSVTGIAQTNGTLEFTSKGSSTTVVGPSVSPIAVEFWKDGTNPIAGLFASETNALTATFSLRAQQYSMTLTGTTTNVSGMTFGGRTTASTTGGPAQEIGSTNLFAPLGAGFATNGAAVPLNSMFQTSPSTTPATRTNNLGDPTAISAVGFDAYDFIGAYDDGPNGLQPDANHAVALYNTVEPLYRNGSAKDGRFYYGELVVTFNRPVKNPVIHIGGLGGSYSYLRRSDLTPQISYFTTELELVNSGVSSTFMAGNEFFQVDQTTNKITNGSNTPNGGSFFKDCSLQGGCSPVGSFNNYGAASGSVRVNGVVSQLVYKIYIRGSAQSTINFSRPKDSISNAVRDPFNGDLYYMSVSLDKPTQQISGNIFIDRDGLTDNNINQSAGVANPKTNLGTLFANLLNTAGQVVASVPVSNDGVYLFDNVPVGTYSVQLSINSSLGTYASPAAAPATVLPNGWANTGEFVGNVAGNDGTVNGRSSSVVVNSSDIKVEVNFGIERLPESNNYISFIGRPTLNSVLNLTDTLPLLSGSDPEDLPISGPLTGRALRIDTLPNNATLLYGGLPVSVGQVIPNYNPTLLQVKFTFPSAGLSGEVKFNYSFIDAAGLPDPTPAYYIIRWPQGAVLPIILSDFAVLKNNCNVNLNWKTSLETDSDRFEVEFSTDANTTFEKIGTVAALGFSSSSKVYQFNYSMESGVVHYFRLKMIKKDGGYSYSEIRRASCVDSKSEIAIAPNPTTNVFHITGMAKGKNTVTIYSKDGKMVNTLNVINNKDIDVSNLASGVYVIRIINENGTTTTERLVKY
jgi:Secretion system C-terminal sorting domain